MYQFCPMKTIAKIPGLSVLLLFTSYAVFGWLLAIHGQDWRLWIASGAISLGIAWFTAIAWAVVAVVIVFSQKTQIMLSLGIFLIWAFLMYIARLEMQAFFARDRVASFVTLGAIAALGMGFGWFADANLIRSVGKSLMELK
jgi:hypothetical protein